MSDLVWFRTLNEVAQACDITRYMADTWVSSGRVKRKADPLQSTTHYNRYLYGVRIEDAPGHDLMHTVTDPRLNSRESAIKAENDVLRRKIEELERENEDLKESLEVARRLAGRVRR